MKIGLLIDYAWRPYSRLLKIPLVLISAWKKVGLNETTMMSWRLMMNHWCARGYLLWTWMRTMKVVSIRHEVSGRNGIGVRLIRRRWVHRSLKSCWFWTHIAKTISVVLLSEKDVIWISILRGRIASKVILLETASRRWLVYIPISIILTDHGSSTDTHSRTCSWKVSWIP